MFPNSNLLNLNKQAKPFSIGLALLEQSIQDSLGQVATNKTNITAINDSIGQANGIAPLDAAGKLATQYLPAMAIGETFTVAAEADMLTLVAQTGDVAVVTGIGNYRLAANDPSVAANWVKLVDNEGVESILIDGVASTGQVSLHKLASTGNSADAVFADAGFTATNAKAAILEVKGAVTTETAAREQANVVITQSVTDEALARTQADANLQSSINVVSTAVATKLSAADMKLSQPIAGTIDGTNKVFTLPEAFADGSLRVWFNNAVLHPDAYTRDGLSLTFPGSPDPGDALFCDYIQAAA